MMAPTAQHSSASLTLRRPIAHSALTFDQRRGSERLDACVSGAIAGNFGSSLPPYTQLCAISASSGGRQRRSRNSRLCRQGAEHASKFNCPR